MGIVETTPVLILLAVALITILYMFNDTIKGGMDVAGANMRYLYNRTSTNLGLSSFNDDELSDSEKSRNIKRFRNAHIGGLYNEGNTCFMNSVIQALASCQPISEYSDEYKDDINFCGGLHDTIVNLNQIHTRNHNYSALKLIGQVGGGQRWSRYNQEDAQEFFQELLTSLENDRKNAEKKENELEESLYTSSGLKEEKTDEKDKLQKLVTPFDGKCATRVGCLACGDMEGIRNGVISSVDLSLELNTTRVSLHELLQSYTDMETISGVECYRCSLLQLRENLIKHIEEHESSPALPAFKLRLQEVNEVLKEKVIDEKLYGKLKFAELKVQSDKTKQTMFARTNPDTLMIHINRSVFDLRSGIIRKNFAKVDFPPVLNLAPYTCDPTDPENTDPRVSMHSIEDNKSELYDLKAAVIHYGSANFGHYICFRKFHGLWWRISDDQVDLTTEAQVLNTQGVFMLFYEKRGAAKTAEYPTVNFMDVEIEGSGVASDDENNDLGEEGDNFVEGENSEDDTGPIEPASPPTNETVTVSGDEDISPLLKPKLT